MNRYTTFAVMYAMTTLMSCAQNIKNSISIETPKQEILKIEQLLESSTKIEVEIHEGPIVPKNFETKYDSLEQELYNQWLVMDELETKRDLITNATKVDTVKKDSIENLIYHQDAKIFAMNEVISGNCEPLLEFGKSINRDFEPFLFHPEFRLYKNLYKKYRNPNKKSNGRKLTPKEREKSLNKYQKAIGLEQKKNDGKPYMETNFDLLTHYEKITGFPMEQAVATHFLETNAGNYMGEYAAFNVPASKILYGYKKELGEKQMEQLFEFCDLKKIGPFDFPTSWGFALGHGQKIMENVLRLYMNLDLFNFKEGLFAIFDFNARNFGNRKNYYRTALDYNHDWRYAETIMDLTDFFKDVKYKIKKERSTN